MIQEIKAEDLRRMKDSEGLILQGCGGNPQEWLDGINEMLRTAGILRNGSKFESCSVFQHDGRTCILFPFEDVDPDVGKLAMWRLQTYAAFSGTWLSDFVPNRLGGFVQKSEHARDSPKPNCALIGQDGNIFNLMGIAARTLRRNGMAEQAAEMQQRITESDSYESALCIIGEYVNITDGTEETEEEGMAMT